MENLEQPEQLSEGSNQFGKFKDAESLMKAYSNLESEFTKKSQRLKMLETESEQQVEEQNRRQQIESKVDDFVTKFEIAKPFSNVLKEKLATNQDANLECEFASLVANNYKTPDSYIKDDEFLNNYVYSNADIKDKIIKDYLSKLTHNSPIKIESSASSIPLTPPRVPTTISEAGKMAKSIIKQK